MRIDTVAAAWKAIATKNVRKLRQQRKLMQDQLAFASRIDLTYLGGIERGQPPSRGRAAGRRSESSHMIEDDETSSTKEPPNVCKVYRAVDRMRKLAGFAAKITGREVGPSSMRGDKALVLDYSAI